MAIKSYASLKGGWQCCWIGDSYQPDGCGSFQVRGTDASWRTREIVEALKEAVVLREQSLFDGNGYESSRTWEIGEIRIRKHSVPNISMVCNDVRILFHCDAYIVKAIIEATEKALKERAKRWGE